MLTPLISSLSTAHGFFTRQGGVSSGVHDSLNTALSSQDTREHVEENRRRIAAYFQLSPDRLVTLSQIHSPTAHIINGVEHIPEVRGQQGDGMATNTPGVILGILTADCAPVLFHDVEAGVIGAAHAGWNGAFSGVLESTVAAMVGLGAKATQIRAVIGPCIAQPSYEVDNAFYQRFLQQNAKHAQWFAPSSRPHHWQFDLKAYAAERLRQCGIAQLSVLPEDTYTEETRFFSYRRMTHRQEADYGRQMSCILLPEG